MGREEVSPAAASCPGMELDPYKTRAKMPGHRADGHRTDATSSHLHQDEFGAQGRGVRKLLPEAQHHPTIGKATLAGVELLQLCKNTETSEPPGWRQGPGLRDLQGLEGSHSSPSSHMSEVPWPKASKDL